MPSLLFGMFGCLTEDIEDATGCGWTTPVTEHNLSLKFLI